MPQPTRFLFAFTIFRTQNFKVKLFRSRRTGALALVSATVLTALQFRPAVLRANRITPAAKLPPQLVWHALRHTYASLCIAAGRPPLEVARFMGHAKVTTTLAVYAHLYSDDHTDAMAALGAMETGPDYGPNVIPLRG